MIGADFYLEFFSFIHSIDCNLFSPDRLNLWLLITMDVPSEYRATKRKSMSIYSWKLKIFFFGNKM